MNPWKSLRKLCGLEKAAVGTLPQVNAPMRRNRGFPDEPKVPASVTAGSDDPARAESRGVRAGGEEEAAPRILIHEIDPPELVEIRNSLSPFDLERLLRRRSGGRYQQDRQDYA